VDHVATSTASTTEVGRTIQDDRLPGPNQPRIPIVFIAGYSRSGSTVLERVLALDERFVALGEVKQLWELGYTMNALCGCGVPFRECEFWQDIDDRAFGGLPLEKADALHRVRRRVVRPKTAGHVLTRHIGGGWRSTSARVYLDHAVAVYRAALEATGASVAIDASKDAVHALLLATRPELAVHVIHLVRDPRGVAYSCTQRKRRPEIYWKEQFQSIHPPRRTAVAWAYRNALAETLRIDAASYQLLRYEDFVADPVATVRRIRQAVGLEQGDDSALAAGRVVLPVTHSIAGNGNRFENPAVELRSDERWRTSLPRRDQVTTTILTSPLIARYGYGWGG
jgi:hypothetical protein